MFKRCFNIILFLLTVGISYAQYPSKQSALRSSKYYYEQALESYESNDRVEAKFFLDSSLTANPSNDKALYLRGLIKEVESDPIGALTDYELATRLNPGHLEAFLGKALIYHQQNNFEESVRSLNYILQYDGVIETNAVYFKNKAYTKDYKEAPVSGITSLASMKTDILYRRSMVYRDMGKYEQAMRDINNVLEADPANPEYYTARGLIYHKVGDIDSAKYNYRLAMMRDPQNKAAAYQMHLLDPDYDLPDGIFEGEDFHYAFAKRAYDYFERGDYKLALQNYNDAIQAAPQESDYYSARGLVYEKMRKYNLAISDFKKALELDSYFIVNYYRIGNILFRTRKYSEANQFYNLYLSYAPDDERILYNSAMVHLQQKENEEACKKLSTSAELGFAAAKEAIFKYCKN